MPTFNVALSATGCSTQSVWNRNLTGPACLPSCCPAVWLDNSMEDNKQLHQWDSVKVHARTILDVHMAAVTSFILIYSFSSFKSIIPSAVMCSFSPMLDSWRFILFWCRHILRADIRTRQRSDLPFWTGRVNLVAVCGRHLPFLPITGAFSSCLHWIRPCDGSFLRGLPRGLISKEVPLGSSSKPLELPLQPSRGMLLPRRWHSAVTRPSLHLLYQSAFSTVFPFISSPTATI